MAGITPKIGHPIENTSGESIPPFSVVLVTGVETSPDGQQTWSTVKKYDGTPGNIMVTGDRTIPNQVVNGKGTTVNGMGTAFYDGFLYVAVDDSVGDPVCGEMWGPKSGSWVLHRGYSGFCCQGFSLSASITPKRAMFFRMPPDQTVEGRLTSAVTGASPDGKTGATSFTFKIWTPVAADAHTPKYLEESSVDTPGVNRSTKSYDAGKYCICKYINGSFRLLWVDC